MKTIGLLGGMSWQSTVEYYRIINERIEQELGGHHSAQILISSVDFDPLVALAHEDRWMEIASRLNDEARKLQQAGADFFLIGTNSIHRVADEICEGIDIPLLHIVDATAAAINDAGITKVALLGTAFVMNDAFYPEILSRHSIDTLIPEETDRKSIHRIIFEELVHGTTTDPSRKEFLRIIDDLKHEGAEGVILGCTEIPLLVKQEQVSIPVFDTTTIHAEAAAQMALNVNT